MRLALGPAEPPPRRAFGDLPADRADRPEGGHRFLEDHPDLRTAQPAERRLVEAQEVLAGEDEAAAEPGAVRHEAQDREGGQRLAAAAFTDDAMPVAGI
ncbi:MAG: hypothetical protein R3D25_12640 [Geminicoccaceae bacterium]